MDNGRTQQLVNTFSTNLLYIRGKEFKIASSHHQIMIHPTFPNFKPSERVALRMPMERYQFALTDGLRAGDMLYVVRQDHFETIVEEARTGFHFTVQTLDLDYWTR